MRDSAASMIKAMKDGSFMDAPCFLHTLQLVVNNGLLAQAGVSEVMARLQNCIKLFRKSNKMVDQLKNSQAQFGLPKHALILGEQTRWSSYFNSLDRALEQRRAIRDVCGQFEVDSNSSLSNNDWQLAEKVKLLLQPFAETTAYGERESACVSEVIPAVMKLIRELQQILSPDVKTMRDELINQLKKYFDAVGRQNGFTVPIENQAQYSLATLLDPRFKNRFFRDSLAAIDAKIELEQALIKEMESEGSIDDSIMETWPMKRSKSSFFSDFVEQVASEQSTTGSTIEGAETKIDNISKSASNIIDIYLREPLISSSCDPLEFWHMKEKEFPILARIAKKYLSAPMSTVASEREFKVASNITSDDRIKILPQNAERMLFLKYNLRAIGYNTSRLRLKQVLAENIDDILEASIQETSADDDNSSNEYHYHGDDEYDYDYDDEF